MTSSSNNIIIPTNLNDLFTRIQDNPIYNWEGYNRIDEISEKGAMDAAEMVSGGSKIFLNGTNMFGYLYRNIKSDWCNKTISIVVPGLRDLYWNYRNLLSANEQEILAICMQKSLPIFKDIYTYESIKKYKKINNISKYQLIGNITPYDVLHIPVEHYINTLNDKQPIKVQLYPLDVYIYVTYKKYDFWDQEYQKLVDNIDISQYCE